MTTLLLILTVTFPRLLRGPGLQRVLGLSLVVVLALYADAAEGVRDELARLQGQTGLHLTWYVGGLATLDFAHRMATPRGKLASPGNGLLSPDGSEIAMPSPGPIEKYPDHIAVIKSDGAEVHDYLELRTAVALCWSHDQSKLVVVVEIAGTRPLLYGLVILDLDSKDTIAVAEGQNYTSYTSSQCWSPDDKQLAYTQGNEIRVYDLKNKSSRKIAEGAYPTWSPDGHWIAFRDAQGFYVVSPGGMDRKLLLEDKQAFGSLWWSPDSRFVAYLAEGGTFFETLKYPDVGLIQIRVRRLADGASDWVYQTPNIPPSASIQAVWVVGKSKEPK